MGDLTKYILKAFLRKGLTALGTALLTHGVLTDSEANGLVGSYLEEVTGAALIAGSSVWTYFYNSYVRDKVVTALSLPKGSTPEALSVALGEKKEAN